MLAAAHFLGGLVGTPVSALQAEPSSMQPHPQHQDGDWDQDEVRTFLERRLTELFVGCRAAALYGLQDYFG